MTKVSLPMRLCCACSCLSSVSTCCCCNRTWRTACPVCPVRLLSRSVSSRIAAELLPLADGPQAGAVGSSAEDARVYLPTIQRKWLDGDFRIWQSNLAFPGCFVSLVRLLGFDCVRYRPPSPPAASEDEDANQYHQDKEEESLHFYHYSLMLVAWLL